MEKQPFHFFSSSIGEWKTAADLGELIATMKKHKLTFSLWKVPGDSKTSRYKIEAFTPMVDGRVYLGLYEIQENGKFVMRAMEGKTR
jgi:hypothetical protein